LGYFLITYHQSLLSIHSSCSFIPAILTILRLDFGLFFLITYHQSLLSIHSSRSFISAILTILRLDFGLFFLITYHQSLLSIHSSRSFISAILTILRLDFGLFFLITYHHPPLFIPSQPPNTMLYVVCYDGTSHASLLSLRYTSVADYYSARLHIVVHFSAVEPCTFVISVA